MPVEKIWGLMLLRCVVRFDDARGLGGLKTGDLQTGPSEATEKIWRPIVTASGSH